MFAVTAVATTADAHAEWHRNTDIPMGTPGCPQDACHIEDHCWECGDGGGCSACGVSADLVAGSGAVAEMPWPGEEAMIPF